MIKENGYTFAFNANGRGVTVHKDGEDAEPMRFGTLREAREWAVARRNLYYRNLTRLRREED
jgi:hypothetical protein